MKLIFFLIAAQTALCLSGPFHAFMETLVTDSDRMQRINSAFESFTLQLALARPLGFPQCREQVLPFKDSLLKAISKATLQFHLHPQLMYYMDTWLEADIWESAICPKRMVDVHLYNQNWNFLDVLAAFNNETERLRLVMTSSPLPRTALEFVVIPRVEVLFWIICDSAKRLWAGDSLKLWTMRRIADDLSECVFDIFTLLLSDHSTKTKRLLRHVLTLEPNNTLPCIDTIDWQSSDSRSSTLIHYAGNGYPSKRALKSHVDNYNTWLKNTIQVSCFYLSEVDRLYWSIQLMQAALLKHFYLFKLFSRQTPYHSHERVTHLSSLHRLSPPCDIKSRFLSMQIVSSLWHEHRAVTVLSGTMSMYHYYCNQGNMIHVAQKAAGKEVSEWAVIHNRHRLAEATIRNMMASHYYHAKVWWTVLDDNHMIEVISKVSRAP